MLPTGEDLSSATREELLAALEERTRERNLLGQAIASIATVQTLDEGLSSLLGFVVEATSCSAACIYLHQSGSEGLTLSAVGGPNPPSGFKPTISPGDGIVGRAASSMEPLALGERLPSAAPLSLLSSTEEERRIRSTLVDPIVNRDRRLIGVIVVLSERPDAFSASQQASVRQTAYLAGDLLEHVRAHQTMQRRLDLLTSFSVLSQAMGSGLALSDLLDSLANLTRQMMQADLCVVLLLELHTLLMTVQSYAPRSPGETPRISQHLHLEQQTMERLHTLSRAEPLTELSTFVQSHLNPVADSSYRTLLAVPLLKEHALLGLVYCYFHDAHYATIEDQLVLRTIANHAATALERRRLLDLLTQKNLVKSFFDLLLSSPEDSVEELRLHASFLGLDLQHSHCVALMEIRMAPGETEAPAQPTLDVRIAAHIEALLRRDYPGSLLYHQHTILTCLLDLSTAGSVAQVQTWLRDLHLQIVSDYEVSLSIGLSTPSKVLSDYQRGFAEAGQALEMGYTINADGGVVYYNDLPLYQYLTKFSRSDGMVPHYQEMVEHLAAYDQTHRGKDRLLETLETYLECYGNKDTAAKQLGVHVNTLRQRLERLQEVTGIDVQSKEQISSRFDMQLALRLYRLRSAPQER
jgi:sugar diacid utilization regulator